MNLNKKYQKFLKSISINKFAKYGVILMVSSFIIFFVLEFLRFVGILESALVGLYSYLSSPTLFVIGLLLIPFGWYKEMKLTGKPLKELISSKFDDTETSGTFFGSKLFLTLSGTVLASVIFLAFASTRMLSFMEEPVFCGTACHSTMTPEWTTYQESPHSRVRCVDCHVGEGVGALVDSKINGTWQMISVSLNLYEKPIPTPVHNLRPSRETCEKCHWPEKFYGNRLKTITKYDFDEFSTPKYTTLSLKIDSGEKTGVSGIHWHVNKDIKVTYSSINDKREEILWVKVEDKKGNIREFKNKNYVNQFADTDADERVMDCVDCHNRATHIYENPEKAIDQRIATGLLDKRLPFIKRVGLEAITGSFADKEYGLKFVKQHVESFYSKNYASTWIGFSESIDKAVKVLQSVYNRNIHPEMNIDWGTYPNHIGHEKDGGCFRCHNNDMVDNKGKAIPYDCTTCHSILAYDSKEPYQFLSSKVSDVADSSLHKYLQTEFLNSIQK